jgi:hypothetical protein
VSIKLSTGPEVLLGLADDVRRKTLMLLERTTDREAFWAPPGTANHILWHGGHALWLGDVLCIEPATGTGELPTGWEVTFGMNCRPPSQTSLWPSRKEVSERLRAQLARMHEVIGHLSEADLNSAPRSSRSGHRTIGYCILHGLHDEANHQGEMYLLLKTQRLGHVNR